MADDEGNNTGPSAYDYYNQIFDAHKYKASTVNTPNGQMGTFYADGSDGLANRKKLYISFLHEASRTSTFFKAFITSYNETYTPNWQSEAVFGRADKIHNFVQTDRTINLSFVVPAASESEAFENLGKVQSLIQSVYPNYIDVDQAQTISQGPLVRLKVMNILQNTADINGSTGGIFMEWQPGFRNLNEKSTYYQDYSSKGPEPQHGQLGFISSMTVNHNLENRESGVFEMIKDWDGHPSPVPNTILPKVIEVVISFTPIHEHALGWDASDTFIDSKTFPYGVSTYDVTQMRSDYEGKSWNEAVEAEINREKVEQMRQNAAARYGGMFGTKGLFGGEGRLGRDKRRLAAGKIKNAEKRAYVASAVVGQELMNAGYNDAGTGNIFADEVVDTAAIFAADYQVGTGGDY